MENPAEAEQRLIAEVAQDVVRQFAPEELPLFGGLVAEYFADPTPPSARPRRDDPLGFGMEEALTAVTPAAAAMVMAALRYLAVEVAAGLVADQAKDQLKGRIASLFQRGGPRALSAAQMVQVRQVAVRRAVDFGMDPQQAELMADTMIGSLALNRP